MIKYPIIPVAQTLILSCLKFDLFDVVISPGSRNVPLAIGFASNKKFKCYSIVDERSVFLLGIITKSKKPTILICTSGSALLNYYPAVAEAITVRYRLLSYLLIDQNIKLILEMDRL